MKKTMNTSFLYAIVKEYYPEIEREYTFLPSPHKKSKYILIEKKILEDNSEIVVRIVYSNDIEQLTTDAKKYLSYYNYVVGETKSLQGYVSKLP